MDYSDLLEIVRTFQLHSTPASLSKLLTEHTVDSSGHCPACRSVGPCTLHTAAVNAQRAIRAR